MVLGSADAEIVAFAEVEWEGRFSAPKGHALLEQLERTLLVLRDAQAVEVECSKISHSFCVALTRSLLKPLGGPLVALFAPTAVIVVISYVVLAQGTTLLSGLLVVPEREAVIYHHTLTKFIHNPAIRLRVHVSLGRRFKPKGTSWSMPCCWAGN